MVFFLMEAFEAASYHILLPFDAAGKFKQ